MRMIYLATASKARRKLFKIFGLNFKAVRSRLPEYRDIPGVSYAGLAKRNALLKARYAAARLKHGLVVAADTIVVQDKLIYGKPKDILEAQKMLKKLSRKPQSLYTGIAVIDLDKKKTLLDYELTKVYMDRLNDRQIKEYFRLTSPLDKAGSFDIQGRGAFFIRKVDGCFYNVVGLPLRKLYLMLKKIGVNVFSVSCCLFVFLLSGCTTEYNIVTKSEEVYFYSTDKEIAMGESIDRQVVKHYKDSADPLLQKRVEDIGKKIAAVCDRKDIDYHFRVLDEDQVNAVSLPGGYVYIFKGLIDKVDNDDELAGVIGHEVGHIVARHSIKKLQAQMGYSLLRILLSQAPQSGDVGNAADLAVTDIMMGYSREDELLADQLGTRYAKLAGYNPKGMLTFLEKLDQINKRRPPQPYSYFRTHPYPPDRIRVVRQELGENMGFNDYINIQQKTHD